MIEIEPYFGECHNMSHTDMLVLFLFLLSDGIFQAALPRDNRGRKEQERQR